MFCLSAAETRVPKIFRRIALQSEIFVAVGFLVLFLHVSLEVDVTFSSVLDFIASRFVIFVAEFIKALLLVVHIRIVIYQRFANNMRNRMYVAISGGIPVFMLTLFFRVFMHAGIMPKVFDFSYVEVLYTLLLFYCTFYFVHIVIFIISSEILHAEDHYPQQL